MGTGVRGFRAGVGYSVSNPLGWDGDNENFPPFSVTNGVSNPLGWDGDVSGILNRGMT